MDAPLLPDDFREFLRLLNANGVDYLVVGGYAVGLEPKLFIDPSSLVRFGVPPFRIEIMTSIDGVHYEACRQNATIFVVDGVTLPVISIADLKTNKRAAGRNKDLADLDQLP